VEVALYPGPEPEPINIDKVLPDADYTPEDLFYSSGSSNPFELPKIQEDEPEPEED
jgi:hypothetical protein